MQLTHVAVRNYKGLSSTRCPLSDFVCAIGENNAGKSSLLKALLLFINGPKLLKAEFYDADQDIVITVSLKGVTEEVLTKLTEEHRSKLLTGRNWSMEGPFRTCD
jgi:predicted ATP-dependent endonuclease of OLD family